MDKKSDYPRFYTHYLARNIINTVVWPSLIL